MNRICIRQCSVSVFSTVCSHIAVQLMGVDDAENGASSGNFVTEMRKRDAKMFGNTVAVDIVYLLSVSLTPPLKDTLYP